MYKVVILIYVLSVIYACYNMSCEDIFDQETSIGPSKYIAMYTKLINNNCTGKDKPKLSLQYHSILHFIDTDKVKRYYNDMYDMMYYNDFVLTTFSVTWVRSKWAHVQTTTSHHNLISGLSLT